MAQPVIELCTKYKSGHRNRGVVVDRQPGQQPTPPRKTWPTARPAPQDLACSPPCPTRLGLQPALPRTKIKMSACGCGVVCMYACMGVCVYVCMYRCVCVCVYGCVCVCLSMVVCLFMLVYVCVCV